MIEGPTVFKKDGIYYMLYSANHFESRTMRWAMQQPQISEVDGLNMREIQLSTDPLSVKTDPAWRFIFDGNENPYYVFRT